MSPEQCRGLALDRRSDVFAAGILLYELTTGTRLYQGAAEYEILHRLVTEDAPAPSKRAPNYPPPLEEIVLKALQRSPALRYPTAEELLAALDQFAREHHVSVTTRELAAFIQKRFPELDEPTTGPRPQAPEVETETRASSTGAATSV